MQEDFRLIVDLVTVLAAAAAGGLLASLLRQPALLGYLLGGVVVGPAGLGLIKEIVQVETLAQFGVAFLLFALGVEFSFAELRKVQAISLGGGGLQMALTILVTTSVSSITGWVSSPAQGVFLGAILSLSSTAVVLKCLMERNETSTPHGQVMLGILVVQDLALGLMLAVLPALDEPPEAIGMAVASALLRIGLFAAGAFAAGILIVPRLLRFLASTESRELFLLGVVALCLGIALLTHRLGFSIEMGAFVAGLMISEVEYADQTLTYVEPIRDIFAALFFVSVGMLIDPKFLWDNLELILGLVALVLAGKFLIVTPLVRAFGYSLKTAVTAGLGLAQIGEFSFVLASAGQALGLVSRRVYLLILGTTALTLVLTPFLLRLVPQLLELPWLQSYLEPADVPVEVSSEVPQQNHVIVAGGGRAGRNILRLAQEHGLPVVVIDQSESAIQQMRELGVPYVYGNAASAHVLEAAGADRARAMAIALPDPTSTRLCLKRALELAPDLDIVVRATRDKEIELLYQLGAREVVQPEFEASLELSAHLLAGMGLPLPAIEREVEQIRNSHYLHFRPDRSASQVSREVISAASDMNSKWYSLPEASPLAGMTLEETDLRRLTGVTLMAIRRGSGEEIDYPESGTVLHGDDRLLLVGNSEELAAFEHLAKGEVAVPTGHSSCQWLTVPDSGLAAGKTLSELDLGQLYGVRVQAIRREGKLIRFPQGDTSLLAGDCLLICGGFHSLTQVQQWIAPETGLPDLGVPVLSLNRQDAKFAKKEV
ncbi:cation:proton antiporter domain-containing protein [Kamptonema formosum]|uniref:cation:proton antiporter domain-containing protein n=1 Tax=Kamptonema formosum TaxID=331992 RepID=UPI000349087E|nr:cation:proton antiporter [Oscillatoria sp. PCC 10802]